MKTSCAFFLLLAAASSSALAQMQLLESIHFGGGLGLPNPASDRALIVTKDFLFAADQDAPGGREGAVYVYTNQSGAWQFAQKLTDQIYPVENNGWFGYALGHGTNSYGEWLAVDSTWSSCTNASTQPGLGHGSGDIQMFKLNPSNRQWEFFQYIHPPIGDEFGNSPAISGDWMVCGSLGYYYNSSTNYAYSGAAFFYQFDGTRWVLRQGPVLGSNGTSYFNFAYTTEIEGTNAFVFGLFNKEDHGALYLYELRSGTWIETGVLRPQLPRPAETFGIAYVQCQAFGEPGIKDDLLVVGAPMRSSPVWTGGVYFFQHNGATWRQVGSFFPTNLQRLTYFGNSGDMQGALCVIGCRFADWTKTDCCPQATDGKGRVYVFGFDGSTWTLKAVLAPESRRQGDWFGSWPATDGTNVYVVSPGAYIEGHKTNLLQKFALPSFPETKGTYNGLFYESSHVSVHSSGSFAAHVTRRGKFSGSLRRSDFKYSWTGQFDASGRTTNLVRRHGSGQLVVELELGPPGVDQIRGRITEGAWSAPLLANRAVFDKARAPAPQAGIYTLLIPGTPGAPQQPAGDGFGTVTIDAGGRLRFAGMLADGTRAAQSSMISKSGDWPLCAWLYPRPGSILGWQMFTNRTGDDINGWLRWTKMPHPPAQYYPDGFAFEMDTIGSKYVRPPRGSRMLDFSSGQVVLADGNLPQAVSSQIIIDANNRVSSIDGGMLALWLIPSSGVFKGRAFDPETGAPLFFKGALLQKAGVGSGFFLGRDQSGRVTLTP